MVKTHCAPARQRIRHAPEPEASRRIRPGLAPWQGVLVPVVLAMLAPVAIASPPATSFPYTEEREPCSARNPLGNLYFGDTHLHTALSLDAYGGGTRILPAEAYRFAKGETINNNGQAMKISAPLDFLAVTDHAEFFNAAATLNRLGDAPEDTWQTVIDAAENAYDRTSACRFTSFVAYEYTAQAGGVNQHRNVIFRNAHVPSMPVTSQQEPDPAGLWRALDQQCLKAGTGCDVLAIPHNSNMSFGAKFTLWNGDPSTLAAARSTAALRQRMEPLVEIYQEKGASECQSAFSSDEECNFEQFLPFLPVCAKDQAGSGDRCLAPLDYVREVLAAGLAEESRLGVNPFELGFVSGTDFHDGLSETNEEAYEGQAPLSRVPAMSQLVTDLVRNSPGGLTGIWAAENSRDALFDAMLRRETYGTSGTRIAVRFFAGSFEGHDLCARPDLLEYAYDHGVPMGGTLQTTAAAAPVFVVTAAMDQVPLEQLQIIKAWADAAGERHETVATIAVAAAGKETLCAQWQDPAFDGTVPAAYYARVLEQPSPRWNTLQCKREARNARAAQQCPQTSIRERAWTSPIWVKRG